MKDDNQTQDQCSLIKNIEIDFIELFGIRHYHDASKDSKIAIDQQLNWIKNHNNQAYRGNLFVVSGPSGTGKTTLVHNVCTIDNQIKTSTSYTTRPKRANEIDGLHYFFISLTEFNLMIQKDMFAEYARVHGNFYGTAKNTLFDILNQGIDLILEIDLQGAINIKNLFDNYVTLVFILPSSMQELRSRLINRKSESEYDIMHRINNAYKEIYSLDLFDYILVNDILDDALNNLHSIIKAQRFHQKSRMKAILELKQLINN